MLTNAFGSRAIRSTLFDVVANGREFRFSGSGFGHGVGLCQVGALARVTAGETPRAVLMHYYPGTSAHAVIAYTTRLTANLVLSSRWKRLLRQS